MSTPIEPRECLYCNAQFQPRDYYQRDCVPCETQLKADEERRQLEKKLAYIRERIAAQTPHRFVLTDTTHPQFAANAWARIQTWQPTAEKPWLGMVGPTGTCKTRMAHLKAKEWLLWKTTANRIPTFKIVSSFEISEQAMNQFNETGSDKGAARAFLNLIRNCDLLVLDDLGKGRLTPVPAAELFALLDYRYKHDLVTIWTSNSQPEDIAANISEDMGAPFAGRLNDASKIFLMK
jgi:DNA replication protein DnaC